MKVAYFDCVSGLSGDMTLAALISAGWPEAELQALPGRLHLEGVGITVSAVRRGPFAATHVDVRAPARQPHRHLHHIERILDAAALPGRVRERAKATFRLLARAEAKVHGTTVEQVHFHEVGAVDAIVDVVGAALGIELLGVDEVRFGRLPLGRGFTQAAHGRIPLPAPATLEILVGQPVDMTGYEVTSVGFSVATWVSVTSKGISPNSSARW